MRISSLNYVNRKILIYRDIVWEYIHTIADGADLNLLEF